jgi:predicted house-cleaning noncanonical NTP pyrophosphatase (MazG superfamily)
MTGKTDFSEEEWKQVLEAPPSAGMIVVASDRGGSIRESFSMAKAYAEARQQHGESDLLDEIVSAKPELDHTRFKTKEEMKEHALQNLRDAVALVQAKASPEELAEYKKFILSLAEAVANARREGFMGLSGERVSDDERAALAEIEQALG